MKQGEIDHFMSKVHPVPIAGCWIYVGSSGNTFGHQHHRHDGKRTSAHRFAYQLFVGPIGDQYVLHRCDVPSCVNPDHLFLGTQADNMIDKAAKGRCHSMPNERHPMHKLTDEDVVEIRKARREGQTQDAIARRFNVARSCISLIVNHKRRQIGCSFDKTNMGGK